jgi:hypothetical protein
VAVVEAPEAGVPDPDEDEVVHEREGALVPEPESFSLLLTLTLP